MPLMEISIVPLGTGTASVSKYVAEAIEVLKIEEDIKYEMTPMGTLIEATSVGKLLDIAEKMHNRVLTGDIKRVVTTIKIDDRRDKKLTMRGKLKSVEEKLGVRK